MKKDEVWERLKRDETEVYGGSMLDMFLKTTESLERRHWDELPETKRKLVNPEAKLAAAETAEDVERAAKEGASGFRRAATAVAGRGSVEAFDAILRRDPNLLDDYQTSVAVCSSRSMDLLRFVAGRVDDSAKEQAKDIMVASTARAGWREGFEFLVEQGFADRMEPDELLSHAAQAGSAYMVKATMGEIDDDILKDVADWARREGWHGIADIIDRELGRYDED